MKKVAALLVLVLVSAALVACGDDDDGTTTTDTGGQATNGAATGGGAGGGGGGAGATVSFEADPAGGLAYTTTEASAKAGAVTIDFNNPQPVAHDVVIEDSSGAEVGATDVITETSTSANIKDLKPGDYTFYCSVPGHREAGMEGTLTAE
jgi:uncharacterized cupredoxin-like copper-binding protein